MKQMISNIRSGVALRISPASRFGMLLGMVFSLLFAITPTWAMIQPEGIPPGRYTIGGGGDGVVGGGGRGTGTMPAYCLDKRLAPPSPDSAYKSILSGGGGATVQLPNGTAMPLQEAIDRGVISISGEEGTPNMFGGPGHVYDKLKVSGPDGAVIIVNEPLALSVEPWLQSSEEYNLDTDSLKQIAEQLRSTPDRHDKAVQGKIWDIPYGGLGITKRTEQAIRSAFGDRGIQLLRELTTSRNWIGDFSKLGKSPVVYLKTSFRERSNRRSENPLDLFDLSESQDDVMIAATDHKILLMEDNKPVIKALSSAETAKQHSNIHARLSAVLAASGIKDTAFLVETYGEGLLFIDGKANKPVEIDSFEVIQEWVEERKNTKPSLILISEHGGSPPFMSGLLREAFGDSARILEDDDPELAVANVKAQKRIVAGKDIAVYWDSSLQRVPFVPTLRERFKKADISYHQSADVVAAGNLIIVSGHKASSYRNYLADLAAKGVLKGKSVALLSCAERTDREFSRYLIEKGGAVSVLRINQTIQDNTVLRPLFDEICDRVQSLPNEGVFLDELVKAAAKAAAEKAKTEDRKEKIQTLLDHTVQVSQVFNP
jgi:hypothetical protein